MNSATCRTFVNFIRREAVRKLKSRWNLCWGNLKEIRATVLLSWITVLARASSFQLIWVMEPFVRVRSWFSFLNLRYQFKGDLTGRPRQVELQYYCNSGPFPDRIISIRELSTCSYEVVVQTSRLCGLPGFSTKDKKRPKQIQCVNVVSDAFYELELQSRKEKKKQLQLEAENKLKKMKEAMKQQSQNMAPVTDPSKILQDVVQKLMMGGQGDMQPIHIDFIGDDGRILSADVNNKDDIQLKNKNAELEEGDPKDAPSDDKKRRAQEDLKKLLDDFSGFLKPLVNQQNDAEPQKKEPDASSEQQQGPERKSPVSSTEDRGDTEKPKQQDKKEASVNDNVDAVHDEL